MPIARRPSRRSSQEMCEPSPGTTPKDCTSKTPPSDSLALRSVLISATIARPASASRQRTGEVSTSLEVGERQSLRARSARVPRRSGSRASAPVHPAPPGMPCRARHPPRAPPSREPRRARGCCARRSACTSACPRDRRVRDAADEPPGSPRRPATATCALPSWRSRGSRPARRPARRASDRGVRRPLHERCPSRSSCARRGRDRAGGAPCPR